MADTWEYAVVDFPITEVTSSGNSYNREYELVARLNGQTTAYRKNIGTHPAVDVTTHRVGYFQELGAQGWELVAWDGNAYVFKRRKP